jgi:thiol-disulfide isomerase/thioredoxin
MHSLLLFAMLAGDMQPDTGQWRAWLDSPGGQIPFGLELESYEDLWKAWIVNATERIELLNVSCSEGVLTIQLDPYDSKIVARVGADGKELTGEWTRYRGPGKETRMVFGATAGASPRFEGVAAHDGAAINGRWAVQFSSDESASVGLFHANKGGAAGTFLTTLGDYRFLSGGFDGKRMRLSCFDGAHAFLFDAKLQEDGTLSGDFWSRDSWHETWTAKRDESATLPDPFGLTEWKGRGVFEKLAFPDLDGKSRSMTDPEFLGKARLVVLFGSWCPNCHDESDYLVELDQRFRSRGLEIQGLAFEFGDTLERNTKIVREYAGHHHIKYPLLIAGPSDKAEASKAFPAIDRVRAYPTTLFIDGKGEVRAIYTGFSGPATGPANTRLRERFEGLIEELLGESD